MFGYAEGGIIPQGFPNDSYPAALSSGELVVPRDLVRGLDRMIARDDRGGVSGSSDGGVNTALLLKIANLLSQPMQVSTSAEVNGKAFADIILQLNRQNARLTA